MMEHGSREGVKKMIQARVFKARLLNVQVLKFVSHLNNSLSPSHMGVREFSFSVLYAILQY